MGVARVWILNSLQQRGEAASLVRATEDRHCLQSTCHFSDPKDILAVILRQQFPLINLSASSYTSAYPKLCYTLYKVHLNKLFDFNDFFFFVTSVVFCQSENC